MLQSPSFASPFVFSDGRKKSSSSTNNPRFLSNTPKFDPRHLAPASTAFVNQKRTVEQDLPQDYLSFTSCLSASTSLSSLPSPSFPTSSLPQAVPRPSRPSSTQARSTISSTIDDILAPGDLVGEGIALQGELLRLVPHHSPEQPSVPDHQDPAQEFEVVGKLGTGSYAIVYLVREVLSRSPPSEDGHMYAGGPLELDDAASVRPPTEYGRNYAIKLLSKVNLDEDELFAQLAEATIHQSIPVHPNIVTLHRTLETSAYLLLLLEFVPGPDLFYFLEQARDHYDVDPTADPALTHTPPTPGLLSSHHPSQLLSHKRLRLIASMFAQMCEAVAACHDASVFHRDIKPENFIVTDGWTFNQDGIRERKVIVKLSDFGLSTCDAVSSDMDCGSAPYMSYECRNNVAPSYKPRAADVWSLGIVLINMIYHCNPWVDTHGCSSFDQYLSNRTEFFMRRFAGMTFPVANFLVENVFCVLDEPSDDSQRIGAREFGVWVRDLPAHMGASQPGTHTHSRVPSTASANYGHALASAPPSHRPASRQSSIAAGSPRRPPTVLRSLSRTTSVNPVLDHDGSEGAVRPALGFVLDEDEEEDLQHQRLQQPYEQPSVEQQLELDAGRSPSPSVRSTSNPKRRRRGRKGKGMTPSLDHNPDTSELLLSASQTLVRELSRQPRSASASVQSFPNVPPPLPPPVPEPVSTPTITKKPSRWKLSFGRSAGEAALSPRSDSHPNSNSGSARAVHVANAIMGLSPPPVPSTSQPESPPPTSRSDTATQVRDEPQLQQQLWRATSPTSTRSGRAVAGSSISSPSSSNCNWRNSMASTNTSSSTFTRYSNQSTRSVSTFATSVSASSTSSNWRKHPEPVFPSSSSLASSLYSNTGSQCSRSGLPQRMPSNVKRTYFSAHIPLIPGMQLLTRGPPAMTGVPWELSGAPRQLHQESFGAPPPPRERKRAARGGGKCKQPATGTGSKSALEPITERPQHLQTQYRQDAATSTTDLASQAIGQLGAGPGQGLNGQGQAGQDGGDGPKVGKAQINALAKMLSALRR